MQETWFLSGLLTGCKLMRTSLGAGLHVRHFKFLQGVLNSSAAQLIHD